MEGEFQDWELLHASDSDSAAAVNSPKLRSLDEIEADSEGVIRSDYFSLHGQGRYVKTAGGEGDLSEDGSVESDNPSWIDPASETRYTIKNSGEFWSDSGSDRSDERKLSDFEGKHELGVDGTEKNQLRVEGIGEMEAKSKSLDNTNEVKSEASLFDNAKSELDVGGFGEIKVLDKNFGDFWSDSGGDALSSMKFEDVQKENQLGFVDGAKMKGKLENSNVLKNGSGGAEELSKTENESSTTEDVKSCVRSVGGNEKRTVVWWKVPFEVLKYCLFKVSPAWSFSVAAAFMGLVILGRRYYKMKRKSHGLQLKVTVDEKKVSQFMSRAARLNEAFSVVRRVPIVRPALPAAGVNPWPMMSLR